MYGVLIGMCGVRPEDLVLLTEGTQLVLRQIAGMSLDVLSSKWNLSQDLNINYIACFQKQLLPRVGPIRP